MTWRTWAWRGPFLWFFLVILVPMLLILIPINTSEEGLDRIIGNIVLLAAVALMLVMHNWITVGQRVVKIGFFPLYWRTLAISEIRYAMPVEFNPLRDFAGWGIKGLAKSRNGLLLGGNPPHGIMIETLDRRRYVLSFEDSEPVLQALAAQGCTLAAGIDDMPSGEV